MMYNITASIKTVRITTETWLPVFPGFYETLFDGEDMYCDEIERIEQDVEPEALAKAMLDNIYNSEAGSKLWREYYESTAKQCVNVIWNNLRNLGFVTDINFQTVSSPREYNFMNDCINIVVTFSEENIANIKKFISEHFAEWTKYLHKRYTSYDGFISRHDNFPEADEWQIETALNDSHNAGSILEFICRENNITEETLYYGTTVEVSLDLDAYKKECIKKGWYEPKRLIRLPRINIHFRTVKLSGSPRQFIFETVKQRYIFTVYKDSIPYNKTFISKKIFGIFLFAKLKEEKRENNNRV